jgi:hypothetical protein
MSRRSLDVDGYKARPDRKSRHSDAACCSPFWSKFYLTPMDLTLTIGWGGIIYTVWTLCRAVMHILQLSKYAEGGFPLTTMISFSFAMSEAGVLLILLAFLGVLAYSSSNDFYDLRGGSPISFYQLRNLLRARANIDVDLTLVVRGFILLLGEIALICVLTWDPRNYDGNLYASHGVVTNNPIVIAFYTFVVLKDLYLLGQAYDRKVTSHVRDQVLKVDAAIDKSAGDEDAEVPEGERALLGSQQMSVL